jgi:hypothetical protein
MLFCEAFASQPYLVALATALLEQITRALFEVSRQYRRNM